MPTRTGLPGDGIEALVVGVVLVLPILFAVALPKLTDTTSGGEIGVGLIAAVTAMEVPLAALAVWAVRRRGDTVTTIGVVRPHPAWLAIGLLILAGALWLSWQRHTGAWAGASSASGAGGGSYTTQQRLALIGLGIPQIYLQELLYRGFAITFLERLTGSLAAAVVVSSAAFTLAHITSLGGNLWVSLLSVFVVSVLLSLLYAATHDLTPVFMVHWAWVAWLYVGLSGHAAAPAQPTVPASNQSAAG